MTDPVEVGARSAAARLVDDTDPTLPRDVERALVHRDRLQPPSQYLDLISLGALVVSVASLAWTVYNDLRKKTPSPSPDVVARTVPIQLEDPQGSDRHQRDRIIDITVQETIKASQSGLTRQGVKTTPARHAPLTAHSPAAAEASIWAGRPCSLWGRDRHAFPRFGPKRGAKKPSGLRAYLYPPSGPGEDR